MKRHVNLFYPFLKIEKQFPKYYNPPHSLFAHNKIKFKETLFWGGGKSWKLNGEIKCRVVNDTSKNVGLGKFCQDLEISEAFMISLEVSFFDGLFLLF